ncbi:MAG TPA: family 16 glycoside hydrolase [Armatimonadota bacterium]|jgi:alpha-L-arabinofuranosidase
MNTRATKAFVKSAIALAALVVSAGAWAREPVIHIQAGRVLHSMTRQLTGVCIEDVNHEIYGGLYSQMIFGESFQEPAPPAPIRGFAAYGGRWRVQAGALRGDASDGAKLVSSRPAFLDGSVSAEMMFPEGHGENAGLIVRVSGPRNGADAFTGYEVSLDPSRQVLRLARHRDDYELIQDVPCEVPVGRWFRLQVKLAGPVIEVLVDGKTVLTRDDGPLALSAGTVGLRTWRRAAAFRNLTVATGGATEPLAFTANSAAGEVSGMWRAFQRGTARGVNTLVGNQPFVGRQSQQIRFASGAGAVGIENQGLNRWGMSLVAGKAYEGRVWARSSAPVVLYAALESRDGSRVYAEKPLRLAAGSWRKLAFSLTPSVGDRAARFSLKMKRPGSVTLGYAFLQPGGWGRYKGLPVRGDVALGLVEQGVTVMRYGGSMVNAPDYRWKTMIGPRDRRPPYSGTWYPYSSNGWGIPDFMSLCEAAGIEYVPDFSSYEKPQDMADFIEYAKGPASSRWGGKRATDGHLAPYRLKYIELGNEERVDDRYAARFEALARAIWAKDPRITLIVGDFLYRKRIVDSFQFSGADSGITTLAAHRRILRLAKENNREVWFDVHVGTERPMAFNEELDGMFSYVDALSRIADGARHKVVVFEYNAQNHAVNRALANAIATHAIERDGRIPMVTSANGLQPDGQNDNGWDQGLLFLNPWRVWLQPPGYAARMLSRAYLPLLVRCDMAGAAGQLDVVARRSMSGRALGLEAVNPGDDPVPVEIRLSGYVPRKPWARVTVLAGPLDAVNTAANPGAIVPKEREWTHGLKDGVTRYTFPPRSFTVIRFE